MKNNIFKVWFVVLGFSSIAGGFIFEFFRYNGLNQEWTIFFASITGMIFGIWIGTIIGTIKPIANKQQNPNEVKHE